MNNPVFNLCLAIWCFENWLIFYGNQVPINYRMLRLTNSKAVTAYYHTHKTQNSAADKAMSVTARCSYWHASSLLLIT